MSPLENVPRREEDIEEYSEHMIQAIRVVRKNFSQSEEALKSLENLLEVYRDTKEKQIDALNEYQRATATKDQALEELVRELRNQRKEADKLSEADQDLWSNQFSIQENTQELPGAPRDITARRVGPGAMTIEWRRPKRGSGGKVLFYEVVLKDISATTGWQIVATTDAQTREAYIKDQEQGKELSYYVFAKNRNGRSPMVEDPIKIIL
ncbi:MAG: fibronectin type III domain-containing protein [Candidatus Sumerlaeia bacterium]|nr:fibronectin type III domain-containing protein [Candidatus Sumerlaeia bacterium]